MNTKKSLCIFLLICLFVISACSPFPLNPKDGEEMRAAAEEYINARFPFETFEVTILQERHEANPVENTPIPDFIDYNYWKITGKASDDTEFEIKRLLPIKDGKYEFSDNFMSEKYSEQALKYVTDTANSCEPETKIFSERNFSAYQYVSADILNNNPSRSFEEISRVIRQKVNLWVTYEKFKVASEKDILKDIKMQLEYIRNKTNFENITICYNAPGNYRLFKSGKSDEDLKNAIQQMLQRNNL